MLLRMVVKAQGKSTVPDNLLRITVKPVLSGHSKRRQKIGFQDRLSLNAGQKYCRMLQGEHSALLSTFIKLLHVIKIVVLSILEWPLKTGFTINCYIIFRSTCYVKGS